MTARQTLSEASAVLRLKAAVDTAGSLRAFAEVNGLTHSYVSQVLRGATPMSKRLAESIGLERRVVYVTVNGKGGGK